jgi:hypothetical protein
MAGDPPTAAEKETLVSSFLEIAAGQTPETATQFLLVRFPLSPKTKASTRFLVSILSDVIPGFPFRR